MENSKILDSIDEIKKIDPENVMGSADALSDQCKDAWDKSSQVNVPENYKDIENIIMCGMGGSGLGARLIESVYADQLKFPLVRVNDYNLPAFAGENSLVICSSYSGTTEETVENAAQAVTKNCKWMAIGTGNTLIEMAQKANVPYYKIEPVFNPSKQPRMAIGYSVFGQLVLASKAGLFELTEANVSEAIAAMRKVKDICALEVPTDKNPAKQLALKLKDKISVYFASGHLNGAIHTINNQLNENAKNLSFDTSIPELNHHLMEGLKHPDSNKTNVFVFLANSGLYSKQIQQRVAVTADVVNQNGIPFFEYKPQSASKLSQSFELIQFGSYVNLYISILYNQNPAPIPWVDYFKEKMGQPLGK